MVFGAGRLASVIDLYIKISNYTIYGIIGKQDIDIHHLGCVSKFPYGLLWE